LRKFAVASEGAPPVSTTLAANFATSSIGVVDIGGKFATSVNDTGGKFQICHWRQRRRWQIATGINNTAGKFATGAGNHQWLAMAEFSLRHPVWVAEMNITACNSVTRKEHFSFIA
jgi:hypothetical protein